MTSMNSLFAIPALSENSGAMFDSNLKFVHHIQDLLCLEQIGQVRAPI